MKICLVSDALPGYHKNWGGSEFLCWKFGEDLQKAGHDVFFLTIQFDRKKNFERIFQIPFFFKNLSIFVPFFPLFSANFPIDIYSIIYSIIFLKKIKPDIIHFHGRKLFLPVMIASLILKIPTVLTVLEYFLFCPKIIASKPKSNIRCKELHGINCVECILDLKTIKSRKKIKRIKSWIKIKIIRTLSFFRPKIFNYFIKRIDAIIFLTRTSKNKIEKFLSNKKNKLIYLYKPNLKKIENNHYVVSLDKPIIVFVGSLYPHKGSHILVRAMSHIVSEIPNVKLLIIGEGDNESYKIKLKQEINKLGLGENIEFLGQKKNEEVLGVVLKSRVVIVPEQWSNDFGPLILLESMSLGKVVVASRIGSNPEFIKNGVNGFLVKHNKSEEFAQKIVWLLKNKSQADLMGQKAKDSVEFLFRDSQIKEIINLYNDIIKSI